MRLLATSLLFVLAVGLTSATWSPRRILFAKCYYPEELTVKPKALFMTCANTRGVCEVRAGSTHTLRAVFVPKINSTDVDTSVRWNSAIELPLPGQIRDACGTPLTCPVVPGLVTRFTYDLFIQGFFPRGEYPVIWSLTDRDTDTEIVCFRFKINIV